MAPPPRLWADLEHVRVELTDVALHPEIREGSGPDVRADLFDLLSRNQSPYLESMGSMWPSIRVPRGTEVEGSRVSFFAQGAAFYDKAIINEPHAIFGCAIYECTFKRLSARVFEQRLAILARAFRGIDRPRRGPGRRLEPVFIVDNITEGSARWKTTLLVCTFIGGAIYGTANLTGQYPAIKSGTIELLKDAGFIARELEPAERTMCEAEYDA